VLALVDTPILTNLVLGENVVPFFLQRDCNPENLSAALLPLLANGPERKQQLDAFARLDGIFGTGGEAPSMRAARAAIECYETKTGRKVLRS
jgi:lipid-A-disaccharide synthase